MTPDLHSLISDSGLPEHEAMRLMVLAAGRSRAQLLVDQTVDVQVADAFVDLVARRLDGEPLQYIERDVPFGPALIRVDERVLIPRPETEELFELACSLVDDPRVIIDLCTGSGNLAIALAMTFSTATVAASDISDDAIDVAATNARTNDVAIDLDVGHLFAPIDVAHRGRVDLVIANPPYLAAAEFATLDQDVQREPFQALVSGVTGLELMHGIAEEAIGWLAPNGILICEIGSTQALAAMDIFSAYAPSVFVDMYGNDRAVVGRMPVE
ncbi:MAG: peptide chain release factor N(5)-glutamine methyltransferase [Acidimicrobiia bacterium]